MNQFDRLEALAQRLVEGAFNRIFQADSPAPLPADVPLQVETREALTITAHKQNAKRWGLRLESRRIPLGEPVITIGRALNNDIILSDSTVSRYHVQLRWRENRYYLYPPRTETGSYPEKPPQATRPHTQVNRQPVPGHARPLAAGDIIELGKIHITIEVT